MLPKIPQPLLKLLSITAIKEPIVFFFQRMGDSQLLRKRKNFCEFAPLNKIQLRFSSQ